MPQPIRARQAEQMGRTSQRLTRINRTGRLQRLTGTMRTRSGGLSTSGLWRGGPARRSLSTTLRILERLRGCGGDGGGGGSGQDKSHNIHY